MKILKNSTWKKLTGQVADITGAYRRLDGEYKAAIDEVHRLNGELNRIGDLYVEAQKKLKKYQRQRGKHGRFVKNNS